MYQIKTEKVNNQKKDILEIKLIKEAFILYKELEFSSIPPENEINYEFSEKFLKAEQELINSIKNNTYQK